jgi:hypothetical protein
MTASKPGAYATFSPGIANQYALELRFHDIGADLNIASEPLDSAVRFLADTALARFQKVMADLQDDLDQQVSSVGESYSDRALIESAVDDLRWYFVDGAQYEVIRVESRLVHYTARLDHSDSASESSAVSAGFHFITEYHLLDYLRKIDALLGNVRNALDGSNQNILNS